jgi:hypothetical protein
MAEYTGGRTAGEEDVKLEKTNRSVMTTTLPRIKYRIFLVLSVGGRLQSSASCVASQSGWDMVVSQLSKVERCGDGDVMVDLHFVSGERNQIEPSNQGGRQQQVLVTITVPMYILHWYRMQYSAVLLTGSSGHSCITCIYPLSL